MFKKMVNLFAGTFAKTAQHAASYAKDHAELMENLTRELPRQGPGRRGLYWLHKNISTRSGVGRTGRWGYAGHQGSAVETRQLRRQYGRRAVKQKLANYSKAQRAVFLRAAYAMRRKSIMERRAA